MSENQNNDDTLTKCPHCDKQLASTWYTKNRATEREKVLAKAWLEDVNDFCDNGCSCDTCQLAREILEEGK